MAVIVNSQPLQRRLNEFVQALPIAVAQSLREVASDTVDSIEAGVRSEWTNDTLQVGFDMDQFVRNIQGVFPIAGDNSNEGGFAILDTRRMGTQEDFELIGGVKGLWHMGTRANQKYATALYNFEDFVDDLVEGRQAVWGSKTPQWWMYEYGAPGSDEEGRTESAGFPATPSYMTIHRVALKAMSIAKTRIRNQVMQSLRQRGVLV